jgi:hypothetical protein
MMACCGLYLNNNGNRDILACVSSIGFPYLVEINLSNNGIESIEQLSGLDAPYLQELKLSINISM